MAVTSIPFQMRLKQTTKARLIDAAEQEGVSQNELANIAIEYYLDVVMTRQSPKVKKEYFKPVPNEPLTWKAEVKNFIVTVWKDITVLEDGLDSPWLISVSDGYKENFQAWTLRNTESDIPTWWEVCDEANDYMQKYEKRNLVKRAKVKLEDWLIDIK